MRIDLILISFLIHETNILAAVSLNAQLKIYYSHYALQATNIFEHVENELNDHPVYCDNLGTFAPRITSNCRNYNDARNDDEIKIDQKDIQKGCDHIECQNAVCSCDEYCCTTSWDIFCRSSEICSSKALCCASESIEMDAYSTMKNEQVVFLDKSFLTYKGLYFTKFAFGPLISPKGDCIEIFEGFIFVAWYRGGMDNRRVILSRSRIGSDKWSHIRFPHQMSGFNGDPCCVTHYPLEYHCYNINN